MFCSSFFFLAFVLAGVHLRVRGKCAEMNPQNGELRQRRLELLHGSIPFIRDAVRLMKM